MCSSLSDILISIRFTTHYFHSSASETRRERPNRLPRQPWAKLLNHRQYWIPTERDEHIFGCCRQMQSGSATYPKMAAAAFALSIGEHMNTCLETFQCSQSPESNGWGFLHCLSVGIHRGSGWIIATGKMFLRFFGDYTGGFTTQNRRTLPSQVLSQGPGLREPLPEIGRSNQWNLLLLVVSTFWGIVIQVFLLKQQLRKWAYNPFETWW